MAPRLSRWIALTVLAAGVVATMLLTTGGTPLLFLWWGRMHQEEGERSQISRQIEGVRLALNRVRAERAIADTRTQLAAALAGTTADPLVLRREGTRLITDIAATAAADSLWRTIRGRQSGIRSVILQGSQPGGWGYLGTDLGPDGVCVVRMHASRSPAELVGDLRSAGGECLFAEQFGAPGKGVRRWLDGVRWGLSWDRVRRGFWYRGEAEGQTFPAWFQAVSERFRGGGDLMWRPLNRLEMACLAGRVEECAAAAGVTEAGWPGWGPRLGYAYQQFPAPRLPHDLLHAVGPQKFGELWISEDPIAVSYARVTGAPIDGWVMQWARRYNGAVHRDNGLSLIGGLSALLWIALLAGLTTQRLKQRAVT